MAKQEQTIVPKLRFPGFGEAWELVALGQFSEVRTGPFGSVLHESDYVQIGTPIITVEHLGELGIEGATAPMVSGEDRVRLSAYLLRAGDIVFSRVGAVDRSALVSEAEDGWLFSGRLLRVRITGSQRADFINQLLKYEPVKVSIRDAAVGQTMASLNTEILRRIYLPLPRDDEQKVIAECLSSLDVCIGAEARKLDALKAHKQGLMQQLFPVEGECVPRLRFAGFVGEWNESSLGKICTVLQGYGFPEAMQGKTIGRFPFCKVSDVSKAVIENGGRLDSAANYVDDEDLQKLKAKPVPRGVTVFARIGEGLRLNRRAFVENECLIDNNVAGLRSIAEESSDYFIFLLSQLIDLNEHCGGAVPSVNKSTLEAIRVMVPRTLAEQERIADLFASVDNLIAGQTSRIAVLQQHKKGLMQGLFPVMEARVP